MRLHHHLSETIIDSPEVMELLLLLMLHALIVGDFLPFLDHAGPHTGHLFHILVLEGDNLLESTLIETQEARVVRFKLSLAKSHCRILRCKV
jgi:hypothetical protein